jgi:MoaA/NifB/PqqE/SkfB family radical SAM enzyme
MQAIHPELLQTIKQADWYYEFCDGLHDWNKGKKTYDAAIKTMKYLSEAQVNYIVNYIVPDVTRAMVREDLAR